MSYSLSVKQWRWVVGGILAVCGIGFSLGAVVGFSQTPLETQTPSQNTWILYGLGCIFCLLALFQVSQPQTRQGYNPKWQSLGLILLLAFAVRAYGWVAGFYGLIGDEAESGLAARQALEDSSYRPIYVPSVHITWLQLWLYAGLLKLGGGTSVEAMRLLSLAFGVGGAGWGYWVGCRLHGESFGLWMGFLLAIIRWSLVFSHLAITGIETIFFTLWLLNSWLNWHQKPSLRFALQFGIVMGLALQFYMALRLIVLGLLVW